jgi:hypothetical protein
MDEDQELFDSAMADTPAEAPAQEQPQEAPQEQAGQPRDDHGRFAPKAGEAETPQEAPQQPTTEPQPAEQPKPTHDAIPPWRLREEAEARRAAEARAAEYERMVREMRADAERRQAEQQPKPDIFENPQEFVNHGVKQALSPVQDQVSQLREFYSRRDAIREHGQETVTSAYDELAKGMSSRDPEAHAIYQRAMSSLDPFGVIVTWHKEKSVFKTIGGDPQKWFEQQLEERAKDPAFQAKMLERLRGSAVNAPRPAPVTQLPPSLNRVTSSAPADGGDDLSDEGLLKSALRR